MTLFFFHVSPLLAGTFSVIVFAAGEDVCLCWCWQDFACPFCPLSCAGLCGVSPTRATRHDCTGWCACRPFGVFLGALPRLVYFVWLDLFVLPERTAVGGGTVHSGDCAVLSKRLLFFSPENGHIGRRDFVCFAAHGTNRETPNSPGLRGEVGVCWEQARRESSVGRLKGWKSGRQRGGTTVVRIGGGEQAAGSIVCVVSLTAVF